MGIHEWKFPIFGSSLYCIIWIWIIFKPYSKLCCQISSQSWGTSNARGRIWCPFCSFSSFSLLKRVYSCIDFKVGKLECHIVDPLIQPLFPSHDQDLIQRSFEFSDTFIELNVKVDPLISQDDINAHNLNLESDLIESIASSKDIF